MKPKREKDFHNDSCDNDIKRDAERFNRICVTCSQCNVECIEFEKDQIDNSFSCRKNKAKVQTQ